MAPRATEPRPAWHGSLTFGGFPLSLAAFPTLKSKSGESFKSLCNCHKLPANRVYVCSADRHEIPQAELLKGVAVARDDIREVPAEAAAAIGEAERTVSIDMEGLPPVESIPIELATTHLRVAPDPKVPGSEQGVQILWNGLMASGRAVVTEWVARAGSRAQLVAIVADDTGLMAHVLPYATDLVAAPEFKPVVNEQAQQMFEQFAQMAGVDMTDFAHTRFVDRSKERRDELVAKALNGEQIEVPESTPAQAAAVPDLMAAMSAALEGAKPTAKKKTAKAKAKAKATA